jgi:hypothetical protein
MVEQVAGDGVELAPGSADVVEDEDLASGRARWIGNLQNGAQPVPCGTLRPGGDPGRSERGLRLDDSRGGLDVERPPAQEILVGCRSDDRLDMTYARAIGRQVSRVRDDEVRGAVA